MHDEATGIGSPPAAMRSKLATTITTTALQHRTTTETVPLLDNFSTAQRLKVQRRRVDKTMHTEGASVN